MVGSKQLNNQLKTTPNYSLRSCSCYTTSTEENNEDLLETLRKIIREELEDHQEKVNEIIESQLTNSN